jgi:hypothetical protein
MSEQCFKHHRIAFRHQRAIFAFTVLGLLIIACTPVIWVHYDKVLTSYAVVSKVGLCVVDVIALGLCIWHLYSKHVPLKVWSFIAELIICATMVIHAAAILQLDTSQSGHIEKIKAAGEAQAQITIAQAQVEAARIKAAGESAMAIQQQTRNSALARQALNLGKAQTDNKHTEALTKAAMEFQASTFLPDGYMHGGLFYAPVLIALVCFAIAMGISAVALPFEDADHHRRLDAMEPRPAPRQLQARPLLKRPGFAPVGTALERSARISSSHHGAPFTVPPKGSVEGSGEGSVMGSGSGYELPELQNIQWELHSKGGWEAWHVPAGAAHRRDKTYLGYLGKRQMATWEQGKTSAEFQQAVCEWVEQKRSGKV